MDFAHGQGLNVALKPHIARPDGLWGGDLTFKAEAQWRAWFENYRRMVAHYAAFQPDLFVIGTELSRTTQRAQDWRRVIHFVRRIYHGPITYAANHSGEEMRIKWWDALDLIGVDAYYPLTDHKRPTLDELKSAWAPIARRLARLSHRWHKPILFTEIGYQAVVGANMTPWQHSDPQLALDEQANCYRAVFESFSNQRWWRGALWWEWRVPESDPWRMAFTPEHKPAADVLREHWQ